MRRSAHEMKPPCALPQFVKDLLASVPGHGEGVHNWLFRTARVLHPFRTGEEIAATLAAAVAGCGRHVAEREIRDAVRNSQKFAWLPPSLVETGVVVPAFSLRLNGKPGGVPYPDSCRRDSSSGQHFRPRPWPKLNAGRREAITGEGVTLYDLWERSPVRFDDTRAHTEEIIDVLFPGDPWLCVGESQCAFHTRRRSELRGRLARQSFIVPTPMTARTGRTQEGRMSEHALANTGPRRYLVVEFDSGATDDHAALLLHLARCAPLALAVHSAGKSLHGWFHCATLDEATIARFMRYAVSLGADSHLWLRSQFARMPDGTREPGTARARRQTVYFFDPTIRQLHEPTTP